MAEWVSVFKMFDETFTSAIRYDETLFEASTTGLGGTPPAPIINIRESINLLGKARFSTFDDDGFTLDWINSDIPVQFIYMAFE